MSYEIVQNIGREAREAAVRAAWNQWHSLGARVVTKEERTALSIIDPEALVLISLAMLEEERRLADLLAWWVGVASRLLSVQRMKVLVEAFPEYVKDRFGQFARSAVDAKDARWRRYASIESFEVRSHTRRASVLPSLASSSASLFKLRSGFGVTAKADVLAFLVSRQGQDASIQTLKQATGFGGVTIRDATRDMVRARFIYEKRKQPVSYYASHAQWSTVLGLNTGVPAWRYWASVFAFLAHIDAWSRSCNAKTSEYMLSSQARDLYEAHRDVFIDNRLSVPNPADYSGAAYLGAFQETILALTRWVKQSI